MTGVRALARPCVPNGLVTHAIHRSQLVGTERTGKNLGDLLIIQTWLGTAPADPPALKCFSHVLRVSPCRQVSGLDADGPVAAVQNMQARGHGAVKDVVADPVGVDTAVDAAVDPAVAVPLQVTAPVPAAILWRRLRHDPLELLSWGKTMGYGHWQGLLLGHLVLRSDRLLHALTVSCKRSRVNA